MAAIIHQKDKRSGITYAYESVSFWDNLKERLNMRRMLVSSEQSLDGKLFVEFVALIYLSYIKKQMQIHKLFKTYTLQSLLDQVDVIECFDHPGHRLQVGEILQKQKKIYEYMGVKVPG